MILKGSERGSAKELALHLLNEADNDHVEVHQLRGFVSDDLTGAMKEAHAVSRGTKASKFLFSVSLNPPSNEHVPTSAFEDAINRIENKNGLAGHARAIVFHEKNGRRHAHCVWSRVDVETMTAKNLSHYKRKLQDISRELYLEYGWKMPRGLVKGQASDPPNYSLIEWQHAKRKGKNARDLKVLIQDAWAISDGAKSFAQALKERGFILAKGDRRGHVAVDYDGEVYSVARYTGKRAKDVRAKLGEPEDLPSVDEAKALLTEKARQVFRQRLRQAKVQRDEQIQLLEPEKEHLKHHHQKERKQLKAKQQKRWDVETTARSKRLHKGLRGFWQRMTGRHAAIQAQNEREAIAALRRDQDQTERLIVSQLQERQELQKRYVIISRDFNALREELRKEQTDLAQILKEPSSPRKRNRQRRDRDRDLRIHFEED